MPAPTRPPDPVLVEGLRQRLGIDALDPVQGLAALTPKSFVNEHKDGGADNERLEFLGDAVVDLAVSHRLMERFPGADEGELSKLRALLVNEDSLARVARRIGLGDLLRMGRGEELTGGRDKSSVLADALEAVLGAVYLSAGLPGALWSSTGCSATCSREWRRGRAARTGRHASKNWCRRGTASHPGTGWSARRVRTTPRPSRWRSRWAPSSSPAPGAAPRRRRSRPPHVKR